MITEMRVTIGENQSISNVYLYHEKRERKAAKSGGSFSAAAKGDKQSWTTYL